MRKKGVNGLLAVIPDASTNDFILSLIRKRSFIGVFYTHGSGKWSWVDDSVPFTFTNWGKGEPNYLQDERYAEMYSWGGAWNSITNNGSEGYVCQVDPIFPPTTTVSGSSGLE